MADNIKLKEINETTKTFYVNQKTDTYPSSDSMGVSINKDESEYADGIQIPEKLVTVNGNLHYHLIDATNVDWDQIKIPWATKITKWGSAGYAVDPETGTLLTDQNGDPILVHNSDIYNPSYNYNKPQNSWEKGTIRESEEVADILNYLIYRVISLDYFMDHWDERNMSDPVLKLVNNRTDWYRAVLEAAGISTPDALDNDDGSTVQTRADNRLSANKNSNLIVVLYPELITNYWQPNQENDPIMFSTDGSVYGVLMSDLGKYNNGGVEDIYRNYIYDESGSGNNICYYPASNRENYDIYLITTHSTSQDITFNTDWVNILYCDPRIDVELSRAVDTINGEDVDEMRYKYNCPIVVLGCYNKYQGKYTKQGISEDLMKSQTIFQYLVRTNYDITCTTPTQEQAEVYGTINATQFNDIVKSFIRNVRLNNAGNLTDNEIGTNSVLDPDNMLVNFSLRINKTNVQPIFASEEAQYNVQIMKGENSVNDFCLEGHTSINNDETRQLKYNSYKQPQHTVTLKNYNSIVTVPTSMDVYENQVETAKYKQKIVWDADYDEAFDATVNEDRNKSHIKPMFYIKPEECDSDMANLIWENCINLRNIQLIHTNINSVIVDPDQDYSLTVFDNSSATVSGNTVYLNYGQIKWEYDGSTHTSNYWYYPPSKALLGGTEEDKKIVLYMFLYYEYDNITTTRTIKPVVASLPIVLKPIVTNNIVFIDGKSTTKFYEKIDDVYTERYMNTRPRSGWLNTLNEDTDPIGESYYVKDIVVNQNDEYVSGVAADYGVYRRDMSDMTKEQYLDGLNIGVQISRDIARSKYNFSENGSVTSALVGYVLPNFSTRHFDQDNFTNPLMYEDRILGLIRKPGNEQQGFSRVDVEYPMEMTKVKKYFKVSDLDIANYDANTNLWEIPTELYRNGEYVVVGVKYPCEMYDGVITPYKEMDMPLIRNFTNTNKIPVESVRSIDGIINNGNSTATTPTETSVNDIVAASSNLIQVKASTAMFPKQNGMIYKADAQYTHNANDTYSFDDYALFDADRDYFWLAFELTSPAHTTVASVDDYVYDECTGYYFLKVTRLSNDDVNIVMNNNGTLIHNATTYHNITSIHRNIYLDKLATVTPYVSSKPANGEHRWSIPLETNGYIRSTVRTGESTNTSIYMEAQNFHIYNEGDEWTYRFVRDGSAARRSDSTNIFSPDSIDFPEPIGVVTYNSSTDVFANAPSMCGQFIPDASEVGTSIIAEPERNMEPVSGNFSIQSLGAMLYVDKLEQVISNVFTPVENIPNGIDIELQYDLGNDLLYKNVTKSNIPITIKKRDYDMVIYNWRQVSNDPELATVKRINISSITTTLKAIETYDESILTATSANAYKCLAPMLVSNMLTDQNGSGNSATDILTGNDITSLINAKIIGDISEPTFDESQLPSQYLLRWNTAETASLDLGIEENSLSKAFIIQKYPTNSLGWNILANKNAFDYAASVNPSNNIHSILSTEKTYNIYITLGDSAIFNGITLGFKINVSTDE